MNCPVCDHIGLATTDPEALVVGCAFLGHAIGYEQFKSQLCADHRFGAPIALMRCAQYVTKTDGQQFQDDHCMKVGTE
jgi:hypothetical protein